MIADSTPPTLSTGSVDSLTWAGTCRQAMNSASSASGMVTMKTEPQLEELEQEAREERPEHREAAPEGRPHRDRPGSGGPADQSAVISASVVG